MKTIILALGLVALYSCSNNETSQQVPRDDKGDLKLVTKNFFIRVYTIRIDTTDYIIASANDSHAGISIIKK